MAPRPVPANDSSASNEDEPLEEEEGLLSSTESLTELRQTARAEGLPTGKTIINFFLGNRRTVP